MGAILGGGSNSGAVAAAQAQQKAAEEEAKRLEEERARLEAAKQADIEEEANLRLDKVRALYTGAAGSRSLLGPGGSLSGYA